MDSPPQPPRRGAVAFIFITVALDMLAIGVIVPVLPMLVLDFTHGDTGKAAQLVGLFGTVWAVMQFVCSPVLGSLSDRFGRRRIILLSNFGLAFDYVIIALAPTWQWLLVGRVISGITASSIPAAYAYISDVSPPEKRAAGFGILGAAFGLGFVVGPGIGGALGHLSLRLPFWVSAGLSLANALYGLFVLPESLSKDKRMAFSWARANPVGSLKLLLRNVELIGLACVNFLSYLAHVVLPSVFVLYAAYRYGWDELTVAGTLVGVGVGSIIVNGFLVKPAVSRLGERNTLLLGLLFGIGGFAAAGAAPTGPLFLISIPLLSLWGLSGAAGMSLMTARVGPTEQGQLQGANNSLRAITEILGPPIFTLSFAYFISGAPRPVVPGVPFYVSSVLILAATLLAAKVATPAPAPAAAAPAEPPVREPA